MPIIQKLQDSLSQTSIPTPWKAVGDEMAEWVHESAYVGEVFDLGYEEARVLIHDHYRKQVGGIPAQSFLIATRVLPNQPDIDPREEDHAIVLLRVIDRADLPNSEEALRVRSEVAQRISGKVDVHWDQRGAMDPTTSHHLSFAGLRCRVLGTFYAAAVEHRDDAGEIVAQSPKLLFGADLSNFYPNKGLKVYKPTGDVLRRIVNFRDARRHQPDGHEVPIGTVRYASSNRPFQGVNDVPVMISPIDLLAQKTALFGMTRSGKSNTTKIMLQAVFRLRFLNGQPGAEAVRVGQIVFDPNGEYANENTQDKGAIKNVWKTAPQANQEAIKADVVTYGMAAHPNDPDRRLLRFNFHRRENLQLGKDLINSILKSRNDSQYVKNFVDVVFVDPPEDDFSARVRFARRIQFYSALLVKAGLPAHYQPKKILPGTQHGSLFNADFIVALNNAGGEFARAHAILTKNQPSWEEFAELGKLLRDFIRKPHDEYRKFNADYQDDHEGRDWHDDDLLKILEMLYRPNGSQMIASAGEQHSADRTNDYADEIYNELVAGKLVIVDQSVGDAELARATAKRIMQRIIDGNSWEFTHGKQPPEILVFLEEAHNVLPSNRDLDLRDTWVRAAKEGAKLRIGMVYATQEVSSIQPNILRNTSNWLIAHLNNTDETRELRKFYDFQDFERSILRAEDAGFVRLKTRSNPYIVPIQVDRFIAD